ncbi:glutamate 5-kinase [Bacillus pseudomycoides]|uniref:glutamate 5-kinase n=1 Tax=Bacillus pseudomycoides TaxID=64104 RepID=UPI000BEE05D4|nr:glutamate 5-kinase [Bacillus pseudomycoides]PEE41466.1 glutamate 5-kinase [Bacillus pseudomycoides]PGA87924.1 glutamate 5-kinase [Bacillus pseudomycoides]PHF39047.1 glutamate 5-kinase [Bacillus pseudomycoides]
MKKQRIVIKIGSSSLAANQGGISGEQLSDHVAALARLKQEGHEILLITSGAVAAGFSALGYPGRPVTIKGKQAAAAVGQSLLMQAYTEEFLKYGIVTAQLLLTRSDFSRKEQYSNAYATLSELLDRSALPIINENDSISVEELTFGDNDMLSALVSGLVSADMLMIFTDVNGLYDRNPQKNPDAKKYYFLPDVTEEIDALAGDAGSKLGTGGMRSKIDAAKTALSLGVSVFIGTGRGQEKFLDVLKGKGDGTYIGNTPQKVIKMNKQWIALHSLVRGQIEVDAGAAAAIVHHGKSLLPAGVTGVFGIFHAGEVVEVITQKGRVIGKGQCRYSAEELRALKGMRSHDIQAREERHSYEVIHRDNWVSS